MHFSKIVAATAMAGLVSAQTNSTPVSPPQTIDPNSVSQTIRDSWCLGQRNTCRSLCNSNGGINSNECYQMNLTYSCQCANNPQPNITDYQQSLPAQVCRVAVDQCVRAANEDLDKITACRNVICGNRTISADTTSTSSSSASGTSPTGSGGAGGASQSPSGAAPSSTPSGSANMGFYVAESYGLGLFASAVLAIVGFAL